MPINVNGYRMYQNTIETAVEYDLFVIGFINKYKLKNFHQILIVTAAADEIH